MQLTIAGLALAVALLWGLTPVLHKLVMERGVRQATLIVTSFSMYAVCAIAYGVANAGTIAEDLRNRVGIRELAAIAVGAVGGGFLANILFVRALHASRGSAVVTGLTYGAPLFTVIAAYFLLRERLQMRAMVGILLIVAGSVALTLEL